jgi:hypothetical protein
MTMDENPSHVCSEFVYHKMMKNFFLLLNIGWDVECKREKVFWGFCWMKKMINKIELENIEEETLRKALGEILKGFKDEKFLKKSLLRSLRILKI